ncbi:helix-turn-helix domain-containing protein [Zoogloea sp.]|jgi:excisionase family DNA binding protein|uniref:helix-turn-helix domain-containing protein n=1 Tax=Zoogloea sp. TaxID=49181 RepID=UPI0037DA3E29
MSMDTLNVDEAADFLKVHTNTVLRLINDGTIPAAKIGRAYVMLKTDLMAYLEDQVIQQTAVRRGIPLSYITRRKRTPPRT